jgi:hypothetical protein
MWVYFQLSGELHHNGNFITRGWAGKLNGYKNPLAQDQHNIGPLPCGFYTIGKGYEHRELGLVTMNLTPDPENEMFGRSDFRIHGSSEKEPLLSSEGCIILMRLIREAVDYDTDKQLQVISGL